MILRGNLPSINQHREEEEEDEGENNGAESSPGPRHGAGQGQGAAGEAVGVGTSGAGLGHVNVPGNTLGGSIVPPERRVNFSPGVRTPPGRAGQTIGQMSPGRRARAPQGWGRGFGNHGQCTGLHIP